MHEGSIYRAFLGAAAPPRPRYDGSRPNGHAAAQPSNRCENHEIILKFRPHSIARTSIEGSPTVHSPLEAALTRFKQPHVHCVIAIRFGAGKLFAELWSAKRSVRSWTTRLDASFWPDG